MRLIKNILYGRMKAMIIKKERKIYMKRLLRISFNSAFFSFIPILSWFALGLIVDKNLTNVFTLTYPIQFIWAMMKSIFGTGANISKEKDKNKNAVLSGMTLGTIIGFVVFGFIVLNIESYIKFMNMEVSIYKEFATYSVIQLYIQLIFSFVLEKLYFENKNELANKYCITLNILNFIVLVGSSLIFKDKISIVVTTLLIIFIYVMLVAIKQYKRFKFKCNVMNFIKYDSVEIFNNLAFFLIFLFGLSNALEYGVKYAVALNFIALITDTQWDAFDAISTVAKIDISQNKFNYREHRKNAYILLGILLTSIFLMFIILYGLYELDLIITLMFLSFELANFIIYPIYRIKTCYLQLEYSAIKTTTNKIMSSGLRMMMSLLKTPFCTGIGQICSSIYQFITINIMFYSNYKINNDGTISNIKELRNK